MSRAKLLAGAVLMTIALTGCAYNTTSDADQESVGLDPGVAATAADAQVDGMQATKCQHDPASCPMSKEDCDTMKGQCPAMNGDCDMSADDCQQEMASGACPMMKGHCDMSSEDCQEQTASGECPMMKKSCCESAVATEDAETTDS